MLLYVQGDEIYSVYYSILFGEYLNLFGSSTATDKNKEGVFEKLIISAAKVQELMRNKLISIRDTE